MSIASHPSLPGRVIGWIAAIAGASLAAATPVAGQSVAPSAAPAEWVGYAEDATSMIGKWLEAEEEAAQRLRSYLDATRTAPNQPTSALELKIWVAADGTVSRVDFTPFAHEQPGTDLRGLIVGRRLAGPPPGGMRLPLRIAIQLHPQPSLTEDPSRTAT